MERTYCYRGFDVTVRTYRVPAVLVAGIEVTPPVFHAEVIVDHKHVDAGIPALYVCEESGYLLLREKDALAAGRSAGRQLVDNAMA